MRHLPRDVEIWSADLRGISFKERPARSRALLRSVLSPYLDVAPLDVSLATTEAGKPYVSDSLLRFSVSHTGDVWLCAVTAGRTIGIDAEGPTALADLDGMRYVCTDREWNLVERAPSSERIPAFLRVWTRKEAVLKAIGTGLAARAPSSVEVVEAVAFVDGLPYHISDVPMRGMYCAVACSGAEQVRVRLAAEAKSPTSV